MKKILILFLLLLTINAYGIEIYTKDSLYGFKNDEGKIITKAEYQKIIQLQYTPIKTILIPMQSTSQPKAVKLNFYKALKNGKWGILNDSGKLVQECQYDDIKANEYGQIIVIKDNEETLLNPVKNTMKKTAKTLEAIAGLPVTIVAGALLPVEVISKMGKN